MGEIVSSIEQMTPHDGQMSDALLEAIARRFHLLSDPVRLKIISRLNRVPTSVGELADVTKTSQPNVSKHLSILRDAGVVRRRREGSLVIYELADPTICELCRAVCDSIEARIDSQRGMLGGTQPFEANEELSDGARGTAPRRRKKS